MSVIYIFESLHKLIKADNILQEQGIKVRVIPVPTSYHSVCGMCLESNEEVAPLVDVSLKQRGIQFERYQLS